MKNLVLCFLSILIFSCSTTEFSESEEILIPDNQRLVSLFENSKMESDDYISEIDTKVTTRSIDYDFLNNIFLKLNNHSIALQTSVLYTNSEKITGIGLYYYSKDAKNYYFDLFSLNEDGNFTKSKSYLSNILFVKELINIRRNNFSTANNVHILYIENAEEFVSNKKFSDLSLDVSHKSIPKIAKNKFSSQEDLKLAVPAPDVACGIVGNCLRGSGSCAAPSFVCMNSPICPFKMTSNLIDKNEIDTKDFIDIKYYTLRDDFLMKSVIGRKHVGYFYAITDHFKEVLDLNLALKILNVLPEMNNAIDNLFDTQNQGTIITNSLKSKILDITKVIKNNSSSSIFINVVNEFERDFNSLSLKTSSEIYNTVNFEN